MNATRQITIGNQHVPNPVVLAPMSGVTDAPFRRLAERLGAGLVVSEMVATSKLAEGRRDTVLRADGSGVAINAIQIAGCEARWMAEGARIAEGGWRRHHRYQHGVPGQACDQRPVGLGADARSRSCDDSDRRDRRRRLGPGHAQDASWLGSRLHECARTCAPRGSIGRDACHRPWPHPQSILQRHGRLERSARGQRGGLDPSGGEWRHHEFCRSSAGAVTIRRRPRDDRTRGTRTTLASGPDRACISTARRTRALRRCISNSELRARCTRSLSLITASKSDGVMRASILRRRSMSPANMPVRAPIP